MKRIQHEKEIQRLRQELEGALAENRRLKAEKLAYIEAKRSSRRRDSAQENNNSSSNSPSPSYSQPTAASITRAKAIVDSKSSKQSSSKEPHTGTNIRPVEYAGYMMPTEASRNKTIPTEGRQDSLDFGHPSDEEIYESAPNATIPQIQEETTPFLNCTYQYATQTELEEEQQAFEDLAEDTRLRDRRFYSTPAGQVSLPFDKQLRYLKKTYALSQDSLWHAMRERWPEGQKRFFIHGPRSVSFGREELANSIGCEAEFRLSHAIALQARNLVPLRNIVAHPHALSLSAIDDFIEDAQALACGLGDRSRAMQLRCLRDDIQTQATKCYKEILAFKPSLHLPFAPVPPLHFQATFAQMAYYTSLIEPGSAQEVGLIRKCGEELVRAGKQWRPTYIHPDRTKFSLPKIPKDLERW